MSLLVVGSVAYDTVKTPFGSVDEVLGGSATYFSVAASFFTEVSLVAVVGKDFKKESLKVLTDRGIDLTGLEVAEGETFRWSGEYSDDLNDRTTHATHLNVFQSFRPKLQRTDVGSRFLFLGNIDPDLQREVLRRVKPGFSACDTMNFWIDGKPESLKQLLAKVDGLVINDAEARLLAGELNTVVAARRLLALGLRFAVIKRGEFGAALFHGDHYFAIPAYPVEKPIDPTGAGDSFAGGFMGYLAREDKTTPAALRQAMIYGTVMASFTVEDFSLRRLVMATPKAIEARARTLRAALDVDGPSTRRG
jgi:sugar/nucleoside kinase (ribokinase family)